MRSYAIPKRSNKDHPEDIRHKISAHARERLLERLNCSHPVRHVNKVRKEGSLLYSTAERYVLRRNLHGNPLLPVNYYFSSDGWLLTVLPRWAKGARKKQIREVMCARNKGRDA